MKLSLFLHTSSAWLLPLARGRREKENRKRRRQMRNGGKECFEVKDGVVLLHAALSCPDPEFQVPIQNHYSWSR